MTTVTHSLGEAYWEDIPPFDDDGNGVVSVLEFEGTPQLVVKMWRAHSGKHREGSVLDMRFMVRTQADEAFCVLVEPESGASARITYTIAELQTGETMRTTALDPRSGRMHKIEVSPSGICLDDVARNRSSTAKPSYPVVAVDATYEVEAIFACRTGRWAGQCLALIFQVVDTIPDFYLVLDGRMHPAVQKITTVGTSASRHDVYTTSIGKLLLDRSGLEPVAALEAPDGALGQLRSIKPQDAAFRWSLDGTVSVGLAGTDSVTLPR